MNAHIISNTLLQCWLIKLSEWNNFSEDDAKFQISLFLCTITAHRSSASGTQEAFLLREEKEKRLDLNISWVLWRYSQTILASHETEIQKKVVSWAGSLWRPSWDCQHLMLYQKHRDILLKQSCVLRLMSCYSLNGSHEEAGDHTQQECAHCHKRGST